MYRFPKWYLLNQLTHKLINVIDPCPRCGPVGTLLTDGRTVHWTLWCYEGKYWLTCLACWYYDANEKEKV